MNVQASLALFVQDSGTLPVLCVVQYSTGSK